MPAFTWCGRPGARYAFSGPFDRATQNACLRNAHSAFLLSLLLGCLTLRTCRSLRHPIVQALTESILSGLGATSP